MRKYPLFVLAALWGLLNLGCKTVASQENKLLDEQGASWTTVRTQHPRATQKILMPDGFYVQYSNSGDIEFFQDDRELSVMFKSTTTPNYLPNTGFFSDMRICNHPSNGLEVVKNIDNEVVLKIPLGRVDQQNFWIKDPKYEPGLNEVTLENDRLIIDINDFTAMTFANGLSLRFWNLVNRTGALGDVVFVEKERSESAGSSACAELQKLAARKDAAKIIWRRTMDIESGETPLNPRGIALKNFPDVWSIALALRARFKQDGEIVFDDLPKNREPQTKISVTIPW